MTSEVLCTFDEWLCVVRMKGVGIVGIYNNCRTISACEAARDSRDLLIMAVKCITRYELISGGAPG